MAEVRLFIARVLNLWSWETDLFPYYQKYYQGPISPSEYILFRWHTYSLLGYYYIFCFTKLRTRICIPYKVWQNKYAAFGILFPVSRPIYFLASWLPSLLHPKICHLTRHRLGCFCTHYSLGGSDPTPPLLSRKRMDVERRTRRHSKDLDETLPNHFRKFKIEVTCQVKVRSKVKIGCFQVADRSDLKRSIFRPNLSICTPKDQAKVLTSEIIHI